MGVKSNGFLSVAVLVALAAGLSAQAPAPVRPGAKSAADDQRPTFRVQVDAVTQDVIVRDDRGQFIPDLKKDEFEIYEDGVKQDISSMTVVYGGRVNNLLEAPRAAPPEGIILPPVRRVNDTSGRIFVFFVDDLHLQFQATGRVRELFKKAAKNLLHDGDLFGIVSSGPTSISVDLTYDRKRLDEAINKMTGDGLKPSDIINGSSGTQGPVEVRYRAHVAFSTMEEALTNLEKVHNRRKALVWVSEGYDFNPFQNSRLGLMDPSSPFLQNERQRFMNQSLGATQQATPGGGSGGGQPNSNDPATLDQKQNEAFADADLIMDLVEVTRLANRSNVTIYTIDPRGLMAGGDIDEPVETQQWNEYLRKSQDSMRVLAEETGGIAVVNMNDFDKALKRIDNETSDYYVLGYYSSNPDPLKRRRKIEVKVTRRGATVASARKEYVLKSQPRPVSGKQP